MTRPFHLAALALASALVLAACGSSGSSGTSSSSNPAATSATSSARPASVVATKTTSLGTFLVDSKGRALYLWDADHGSMSTGSGVAGSGAACVCLESFSPVPPIAIGTCR